MELLLFFILLITEKKKTWKMKMETDLISKGVAKYDAGVKGIQVMVWFLFTVLPGNEESQEVKMQEKRND